MDLVHTRQLHVALGDVDAAHVIYFPVVFRWHEYNFSEWLAAAFKPLSKILESGFGLPVVACSATYSRPVGQDDLVAMDSWISNVGGSSFTFNSTVRVNGDPVAGVETKHVWVKMEADGSFSSSNFPPDLRNLLLAVSTQPDEGL